MTHALGAFLGSVFSFGTSKPTYNKKAPKGYANLWELCNTVTVSASGKQRILYTGIITNSDRDFKSLILGHSA